LLVAELVEMPTIERERLFRPDLVDRMPRLEDVFRLG
jgi:hypothetical protein